MWFFTTWIRRLAVLGIVLQSSFASERTSPPPGAISVMAGAPPASGMFESIQQAVNVLPNDNSPQTIFIYPGVYNEQVNITRPGPLTIYGYTTDTSTFQANQVSIQRGVPASVAGSNDLSGTLRVHKDNFRLYNVNVSNTFGPGTQAIAISQYGSRVGLYACAFLGYQDTLLANQGTQVYLKSYIEGAVDFLFGRLGLAYFGGNTIGVKGPGYITASGRLSADNGSYVLNQNTIIFSPDVVPGTDNKFFLGRPWGNFAKVIFKNTVINAPINQTIWSIWNPGDERTDNILFAEYNTTGTGLIQPVRPSFATMLTEDQAAQFSVASAVGSDYSTWVDMDYFV